MHEGVVPTLSAWANFYVVMGSSAAALTGLVFIVITIVAGNRTSAPNDAGIAAFSSPTVLHFCIALLASATLSAPWHSTLPASVLIAASALWGAGFLCRGILLTRTLSEYEPRVEDWWWYTVAPFITYAVLLGGAVWFVSAPAPALYAVAAAILLLIFLGIHNAWDVITWIAVDRDAAPGEATSGDGAPKEDAEARASG